MLCSVALVMAKGHSPDSNRDTNLFYLCGLALGVQRHLLAGCGTAHNPTTLAECTYALLEGSTGLTAVETLGQLPSHLVSHRTEL